MLFDFRSPLPYGYPAPGRSFLHEFLAFEAPLLLKGKLSVCSSRMHHVSIQRTECADTTKQDAVRRRFKDLDRKSDGRSVYIYTYIYHDSGDVDLLTEASLRLGPISNSYRPVRCETSGYCV